MTWPAIIVLAAGSYALKLAGVLAGDRLATPAVARVVSLLPPALFGAVVAVQAFESDGRLTLDARVVGLVVAVAATWRRLPFIVIIAASMAATALTRVVA